MTVSGIVVSFVADPLSASRARQAIESDPRFSPGVSRGARLALAMDTPSPAEDEIALHWLRDLSGVTHVDVVFVALKEHASC